VRWSEDRQRYIAEKTVGFDLRGKRIVRSGSGTSASSAQRALRKRVRDYEAGLVQGSEHYRVRDAVQDWLDHGQGLLEEATRTRNRELAEFHVIPKIGGRKVRDLRPDEVDQWLEALTSDLATSSIRRVKSILSRSIRRAMKRGLAERNVADLCDVPRGRAGRKSKSLSRVQADAVLRLTRDDPLHAFIVLGVLTGARTEELRALRWEHVRLESNPPHVEVWRSVRVTGDTKTRKSRRTVALPALAVHRLEEHRRVQARERFAASSWADAGLVFATRNGTEMDAANVRRGFRRALRLAVRRSTEEQVKAGTPVEQVAPVLDPEEWTPREMRHSFVSLLSSEGGVLLEQIADLVGHQGTHVTELVYRQQLKPVIQTGAVAMDALFSMPEEEAD
jgi:integrase